MFLFRHPLLVALLSCGSSEVIDVEVPLPRAFWENTKKQGVNRHTASVPIKACHLLWQACSPPWPTHDAVPCPLPTIPSLHPLEKVGYLIFQWVIFPVGMDLYQEKRTCTEGAEECTHFSCLANSQWGFFKWRWAQKLFHCWQAAVHHPKYPPYIH